MGVDVVIVVIVVVFVVELIETIIPIFILRATTFCLPIVAHTRSPARVGVWSGGKDGGGGGGWRMGNDNKCERFLEEKFKPQWGTMG